MAQHDTKWHNTAQHDTARQYLVLMSRTEVKYFLISTVIHIWQGFLTFSCYFIFDRIVCVLVTFYQMNEDTL